MAFYETVMLRAYENLVDENTVVSVDQGAYAAKQLHELTRQDAGVERIAQMQVQMNRIISVMRELPAEYSRWSSTSWRGKRQRYRSRAKSMKKGKENATRQDECNALARRVVGKNSLTCCRS